MDHAHEQMEHAEPSNVEPVEFSNPMEEAAHRYWRASLMWRDKIPCPWTVEEMIEECHDVFKYRGLAPLHMERLLHEVVFNEAPETFTIPTATIDLGQ